MEKEQCIKYATFIDINTTISQPQDIGKTQTDESDWDEELDTPTNDTIDTDELEAEMKRQKGRKQKDKNTNVVANQRSAKEAN
ncbi:hypothetical protein EVAR_101527_1 [Eumeta japonica]|uniref:Uncharacterized protein n=1 Tax=Eumeta variegata TaxID=151549 RepID=A0A4C1THT3_EUMVA|nr:hypothetical protein EVAR_101527_1 [Eumeta japonica]